MILYTGRGIDSKTQLPLSPFIFTPFLLSLYVRFLFHFLLISPAICFTPTSQRLLPTNKPLLSFARHVILQLRQRRYLHHEFLLQYKCCSFCLDGSAGAALACAETSINSGGALKQQMCSQRRARQLGTMPGNRLRRMHI